MTLNKNKNRDQNLIDFLFALKGSQFEHGEMDADLAGSLLKNLSQLINSASFELTRGRTVKFKVGATSEGSFEFLLKLYEMSQQLSQMTISVADFKAGALIANTLGLSENVFGLIDLIKLLKGKEPKVIKNSKAEVIVEGDNYAPITVNKNVFHLYNCPDVRQALSELLTPLASDKTTSVEVRNTKNRKAMKTIANNELGYFYYEPKEEYIDEQIIMTKVRVIQATYEGAAQWKIKLEGQSIDAKIADAEWLEKFQRGLVDAPPRSILQVVLIKKTPIKGDKIIGKPRYEIKEVKNVFLPMKQQKLI